MNTREQEFSKVLENENQTEQLEQAITEQGREWLHVADEWVRRNPYLAIGIAVAAGCAIASLIRKGD